MDNQRNLILAVILSALVLLGWTFIGDRYFPTAQPPSTKIEKGKPVAIPDPSASPGASTPAALRDRTIVLRESPRIPIRTPLLAGSVNLKGARIDDLTLTKYRETIAKNAPPIRLLSPGGSADAYFAQIGWSGDNVALPGPDTLWTPNGTELAPGKPLTLNWTNPSGLRFTIKLSVDDRYMFTIEQGVANAGAAPVAVRPYALINRAGHSKDPDTWTNHVGPIGTFDGITKYDVNFSDLDEGEAPRYKSTGGWIGFGDHYWLTALAAQPGKAIEAGYRGQDSRYQADVTTAPAIVPPGRVAGTTTRFFAGAKEVGVLEHYEAQGIARFDRAIDWGWFVWFEKPIFYLLDWLFRMAGNFGVAIILLTIIVRGLMFPVAQKQFRSMAGMRVVQPKMKALQEKYKDDKPRLQQEMLKLYQEEKVNPLAGCLPIFLQAPIFYALYKVLMLTIEMRHQPFILWLKDLSAPDPMTPVNLFGLLPFDPPGFLHLGVLAILLGITMYFQFKLNPTPMDDAQKQVFAIMPWVFMFIMAPFAAGLQLYWVVSNLLTIAQQKWLYSRHPVLGEKPA
ncbi:membrane protein insertase YidC [Sphingomonas sp. ID0503]|uniref:membrane protein insertase YidC n=1 Tax=Sphingomonas sp. ID0503 TaxID=3399691 RepID=UPI003AFA5213